MGQSKKQRIEELEKRNADLIVESRKREASDQASLRAAQTELYRYKTEEDRQRRIAEHKKREDERAAERDRLHALGEGVVDLSKISHDIGFDYDHDADGGTVTITLHANAREAKILNAYATRDRQEISATESFNRMEAALKAFGCL